MKANENERVFCFIPKEATCLFLKQVGKIIINFILKRFCGKILSNANVSIVLERHAKNIFSYFIQKFVEISALVCSQHVHIFSQRVICHNAFDMSSAFLLLSYHVKAHAENLLQYFYKIFLMHICLITDFIFVPSSTYQKQTASRFMLFSSLISCQSKFINLAI